MTLPVIKDGAATLWFLSVSDIGKCATSKTSHRVTCEPCSLHELGYNARMRFVIITALLMSSLLSCGPEPIYDDELNLTPVQVAEGALAGTFSMKTVQVNIGDFPLVGEQETGSEIYYLVERTYEEGVYRETLSTCGGLLYETVGGLSFIETDVWRLNKPMGDPELLIDDNLGTYVMNDYVDLWSIRDLPDVYETAFPEDGEDAENAPHNERVFDADGDGNPGVTMAVEGALSGEVFFVQRRTGEFKGVVLSEDQVVGTNKFSRDQVVLGATSALLNNSLEQKPHPDPKESWFEQRRIDEGADCDDVVEAIESGLSRVRPF